jgi:sugar/nucleoside kinase (ribokinase family)
MCVDLVLAGNVRPRFGQVEQLIGGYTLELGGSANIFAAQFARLGGRAGVIGWVGRDAFGEFALERLRETGVDATRVGVHPAARTGLGVALAEPDDRAILTYPGTIDAVGPEQLTADLTAMTQHWHVASLFLLNRLRGRWRAWLEECRRAGVTTSLDPNWDPEDRWEGVRELLPLVDVFLPNEHEAARIAGAADVLAAGRELAADGPLVVIKCGADGAVAFRGAECRVVRPAEVCETPERVADSIGAGDTFDAGFLRAWQLGWDLESCLRLGTRCAVSSLSAAGGIAGQVEMKLGIT